MNFPKKQVYLLHGNEENAINNDRCEIVDAFLSKDEREENYKEFSPKGNQTRVSLPDILPDLMMELGTISFFPGSRRVVVIYNLDELFGAKRATSAAQKKESGKKPRKSKASQESYFIHYLEESLPTTPNVIIFQNIEDEEENIKVNEKSALCMAIHKLGHSIKHSCLPLAWQLERAVNDRDLKSALKIVKEWFLKDNDGARNKIYNSLWRAIVFLLQAKVIGAKKKQMLSADQMHQVLFPSNLKYNLLSKPSGAQTFIESASNKYSTAELNAALNKLLPIGGYVFPRTTDLYVPDIQIIFEKFLVELIGQATPKFKYGIKYQ